ncbi:AMP-binding protein [Kineococcus sp. LSe6-4]|uniref:AMP-binding protein n=1 Tax=Kineococcus halophytocola TaxID=3234027 RepID=A0ABV4GX58_9ACTN
MTGADGLLVLTSGDGADGDLAAALAEATSHPAHPPVLVLDPAGGDDLLRATRRAVAAGDVGPGDLVLSTSGSTSRPRAVVRTSASWAASARPLADLLDLGPGDVVGTAGPGASTLTLHAGWHALRVGARTAGAGGRVPPVDSTVLHVVPAVLAAVLERHEHPHVRTVVVGGAGLDPRVRRSALDRGWRVVEYYGAAELSFVGIACHAPGPVETAEGFAPFPGAAVRVRDGLVEVASPYLARSRLDATGTATPVAGTAFAGVGDVGAALPAGRFAVLGRPGAVLSGGSTVLVAEVEHALRPHLPPGAEVVVCGTPHDRLGEVVTAVVVGVDAVPATLRAATRSLPPAARPRRWLATGDVPRTGKGEPDRAAVARLAGGGR